MIILIYIAHLFQWHTQENRRTSTSGTHTQQKEQKEMAQ
jgi:hypothetical protein